MSADIFVYLDTVQFSKNGLQNRNQIKTAQGAKWLTVPVRHELGRSIRETEIADRQATAKHWKTLQTNYARASGFQRWADELRELLHREPRTLDEVAVASTEWMLDKLNVRNKRVRASEISGTHGQASELVASICRTLGAGEYLTGTGALSYMNEDDFKKIGCAVNVQRWRPFSYEQTHPKVGFVPDLSALDLLLNCPDSAAALLLNAGTWETLQSE